MSDIGMDWEPRPEVIRPRDVLVVPWFDFRAWKAGGGHAEQRDLVACGAPPAGSLCELPVRFDAALPPHVFALEQNGVIVASIDLSEANP